MLPPFPRRPHSPQNVGFQDRFFGRCHLLCYDAYDFTV
jgi:hypothetical protein